MKKKGVLAWPAYANREGNPYNYLIYNNIEKLGYPVQEFEFDILNILKYTFSFKYKILHFHWPNYILSVSSPFHATRRLYTFFIFIRVLKFLKKNIVWTVHNLESHESPYPGLEKKLYDFLYNQVDGFISLNKSGIEIIEERVPTPNNKYFKYIPHPNYKHYYSNYIDKNQARKKLNIEQDKFVFLFIGQIRRYKNVSALIKAYSELDNRNTVLLIAGKVSLDVKPEIEALAGGNETVIICEGFIKDEDLQLFLNTADLVVTPYKQIFNSGSVFLNLSFGKPTLAPDLMLFRELKDSIGSEWLKTYENEISGDALNQAMIEVENDRAGEQLPELEEFDPERVALETVDFYNHFIR